jgi:hypothetical protein
MFLHITHTTWLSSATEKGGERETGPKIISTKIHVRAEVLLKQNSTLLEGCQV